MSTNRIHYNSCTLPIVTLLLYDHSSHIQTHKALQSISHINHRDVEKHLTTFIEMLSIQFNTLECLRPYKYYLVA